MRVIYPKEVYEETERLLPYMEYDEEDGWHLRHDAPESVVERYNRLKRQIEEIDSLAS